ncbi:hypothetical protein JCM8208_003721 [Rhodotorula glutinis]
MHSVPELRALPSSALAPKYRAHLVRAGLIHPSEALLLSPQHLARLTRLAPRDCHTLLDQLARAVLAPGDDDTVASLLADRVHEPSTLTTGDKALDHLLGGHGIRTGTLTEVAGHSSSGKTHLCLQLALTAQLPPSQGGLAGGALFVSSEGTVPSSRLFQLADHYAQRLRPDADDARTAWDFLDNVHAEKAPDLDTLAAVLAYHAPACIERVAAHAQSRAPLPLHLSPPSSLAPDSTAAPRPSQVVLASRPGPARPPLPIKLVLVDSLAAPFRADATTTSSSSFAQRARDLGALGDSLKRLAAEFGCAVVVVNQVSDAFSPAEERPLHPAFLGPGAPHEQLALPVELYSRTQTPHFSGLAASTPSAELKLPWRVDDLASSGGGGVQAALGHAWSNVPSTRVLLLVRRAGGAAGGAGPASTRRAAALVWSPYAPRAILETRLGEGGLEGVGEVCEREVRFVERGAHDDDDDEQDGQRDDDVDVEAEREWWHSQAERVVREAERRALGGGEVNGNGVPDAAMKGARAGDGAAGGGGAQGEGEERRDEEDGPLEPERA